MEKSLPINDYVRGIRASERRILAQAITLSESTSLEHRVKMRELLDLLLPYAGKSCRLGVCGAAGAGKSTFIEHLGLALLQKGHRVAVLAIDPTSPMSGGAILGDKSRMVGLSREPQAFVRPSPSLEHGGGLGPRTREAIVLCEAAGFDIIIVETVGIGQGEVEISGLVDDVILLIPPLAGDELQGIKRGIMEVADHLFITKADGNTEALAQATAMEYRSALSYRDNPPHLKAISSLRAADIQDIVQDLLDFDLKNVAMGSKAARRNSQNAQWFQEELEEGIQELIQDIVKKDHVSCENITLSPPHAARQCLDKIRTRLLNFFS